MSIVAILTTIDDRDVASSIAHTLVERRLAACVQISEIRSVYRWGGAVQEEREFRLLIKTTRDRYADVESHLKALHTYDLPAIFALDVSDASADYADWVESNCT